MRYVIIAGPQSSGKTTAVNYLSTFYMGKVIVHREINPLLLYPKTARLGSIAATGEMQNKIMRADLRRLKMVTNESKTHLAETDVFHLVYILLYLGEEAYKRAFQEYKEALTNFRTTVIFINTKPEVSFARRKEEYAKRVAAEVIRQEIPLEKEQDFTNKMLTVYQKRITDLYPLWLRVFNELNFCEAKIEVENNGLSEKGFVKQIQKTFAALV